MWGGQLARVDLEGLEAGAQMRAWGSQLPLLGFQLLQFPPSFSPQGICKCCSFYLACRFVLPVARLFLLLLQFTSHFLLETLPDILGYSHSPMELPVPAIDGNYIFTCGVSV